MTLRTKIEEAIKDTWCGAVDCCNAKDLKPMTEGKYITYRDNVTKKAVDQICTIFKEEIDQKFRKHRLPTNCSWAMAIKEQIQFDEEYGLYWDFTGTEKDGTSFTKEDLLALINSLEEGKGQCK